MHDEKPVQSVPSVPVKTFAETAKLKLDSLKDGTIKAQTKIRSLGSFRESLSENTGTSYANRGGCSGYRISGLYNLGENWRALKVSESSTSVGFYILFNESEKMQVSSTACGGELNIFKTYIYIPSYSFCYAANGSSGTKIISEQVLIMDEKVKLPVDNALLCSDYADSTVLRFAGSNDKWAYMFVITN